MRKKRTLSTTKGEGEMECRHMIRGVIETTIAKLVDERK